VCRGCGCRRPAGGGVAAEGTVGDRYRADVADAAEIVRGVGAEGAAVADHAAAGVPVAEGVGGGEAVTNFTLASRHR